MSRPTRIKRSRPSPINLSMTDSYVGLLRGTQILATLAMLGAIAYSGWAWVESRDLHDAAIAYDRSTAHVQAKNLKYRQVMENDGFILTAKQIAAVDRKIAFANRLIGKREFSWAQLLHDLDEALPNKVSISSVQHQFTDSTTSLMGVVPDLKALDGLVNTLENHGAFRQVNVSHHQFQDLQAPSSRHSNATRTVIQFDLTVIYQPEI